MDRDRYKAGERLTRKGLFQLVAEEAFKDGNVDPGEQKILSQLSKFLGIGGDSATRIARQALGKFQAGELGTPRRLDPGLLYERVLYFALSHGEMDPREEKMLRGLRKLFRIPADVHAALEEKVRRPDYAARVGAEEKPPTDEIPLEEPEAAGGAPSPPAEVPPVEEPPPEAPPTEAPPDDEPPAAHAPIASPPRARPPAASSGRQAGQKQGSARFTLQPGGLPLPLGPHLLMGGAGIGVFGLVIFGIRMTLRPDQRLGDGAFYLAGGAGVAAYWAIRKAYEGAYLPQDAALLVTAGGVTLPGILDGREGDWQIPRDQIEGIQVVELPQGRRKRVRVLQLRLVGGRKLSLYETALCEDIMVVGRALESYLLRILAEGDQTEPEVSTAKGFAIILGFVLLLIVFFSIF